MRAELALLAKNIGANVRQARTASDLTQREVAHGWDDRENRPALLASQSRTW